MQTIVRSGVDGQAGPVWSPPRTALSSGTVAVAQKRLGSAQHCHRVVSTALRAPAPTHAATALNIYANEWRIGWTQPSRLSRAPTAGLADGSALVLETKVSTATQSGQGPPKTRWSVTPHPSAQQQY
jgi:hypothetical protein